MFARYWIWIGVIGTASALASPALCQQPTAPSAPSREPNKDMELPPPPAPHVLAATVNGQPIAELAVFRGLLREDPKRWNIVRKDVLNYLIDNLLVDQYLTQLKIPVDAKEVDERIAQIKAEAKKSDMEFETLLRRLFLTEEDLRRELTCALRWDKFVVQQGSEKVLREMFEKNKNMFDGSQVQARHILIAATSANAKEAQQKLAGIHKEIDDEVVRELAKLPPGADKLARETERMRSLDKAFAAAAMRESSCPSKAQGGDLGWFPRAGAMVEPFARAAFALKPYQMSDVVATDFGFHLILAIDTKQGKDVKFEEVRPFVQEVYGERLREAIIANYKSRSRIEIQAAK